MFLSYSEWEERRVLQIRRTIVDAEGEISSVALVEGGAEAIIPLAKEMGLSVRPLFCYSYQHYEYVLASVARKYPELFAKKEDL